MPAAKAAPLTAVVAVPFTYADLPLCPLEQVSIETLRFVSWLKARGRQVRFINLRSREDFVWKARGAGLRGGVKVPMYVRSKPQDFLRGELLRGPRPDEVLLWCDFPFSPYTFDLDVVRSAAGVCREALPGAEVKVGGAFWDLFPGEAAAAGLDRFRLPPGAADAFPPDEGAARGEPYGLFQLAKGCRNSCSFCVGGRVPPRKFPLGPELARMRRQAAAGVTEFWNWDQNVLLFPRHFEEFLRRWRRSGIKGRLNFSLGLQPDLIDARVIKAMAGLKFGTVTVPFETGTLASLRRVGKPYTVISSVKRVTELRRLAGRSIARLHCSFIIGYPHDDFRAIFRIFLAVLRLRAVPIPFPLYLFPNTAEYRRAAAALKGKDLTSLHGQLWPLVPDGKVRAYRRLLRFLSVDSLPRALRAVRLLSPEMRKAFRAELAQSEAFVRLCQGSPGEGPAALARVERALASPALRRPTVLHISASPRGARSVSRRLGDHFCREYAAGLPGARLLRLDLAREPLEFIDEDYTRFVAHERPLGRLGPRARRLAALTDKYVALLRSADRVVISSPMYTLSIPAALKCFFELVASRLFYEMNDKLPPRKVCCVLARDGVYGTDPEMRSIQEDSLATALKFIGVAGEVRFAAAQGLYEPGDRAAAEAAARRELDRLAPWFRKGEAGPGR